jgi:simple sugar transport system ATP-binding protein
VHERLLQERNAGKAVLLISSELDEVIGLSDRIAVLYRGEILDIVENNTTREKLGLMMAGVK